MRITNNSGQTIALLKGSPQAQNAWGDDRIPNTTLGTGSTTIVDFNDENGQCLYDLQVTLEDGKTRERRGVNICEITDFIITPTGSTVR